MIYIDLPITKWWFVQSFVGENVLSVLAMSFAWNSSSIFPDDSSLMTPRGLTDQPFVSPRVVSAYRLDIVSYHGMMPTFKNFCGAPGHKKLNLWDHLGKNTSIAWDNSAAVASTFNMTSWHRSCGRACYKVPPVMVDQTHKIYRYLYHYLP